MKSIFNLLRAASTLPMVPVGSRMTCYPAPMDTDEDWLCLVDDLRFDVLGLALIAQGCECEGSSEQYVSMPQFNSFRIAEYNFILTHDEDFYCRFLAASYIAKYRNLRKKEDRIALFRNVLYGEQHEEQAATPAIHASPTPKPAHDQTGPRRAEICQAHAAITGASVA